MLSIIWSIPLLPIPLDTHTSLIHISKKHLYFHVGLPALFMIAKIQHLSKSSEKMHTMHI